MSSAHALDPAGWRTVRGVKRHVDARPPDLTTHEEEALARLMDTLSRTLDGPVKSTDPSVLKPGSRPICSCGCMLLTEDELCPSCFPAWAEREAFRASWSGQWWAA